MNTFLLIPIDERSSLCMIYIETLLDSLLVIIRATAFLTTVDQTSHQLILRNSQLNHGSNLMTTLSQHLLQSLSLWSGTWKTIKNHTLMLFTKAIIYACENVDHQLVWNQLTIVDITLSSLTKFCTVLDFITEYIPCRNVTETIFLDHLVALSTFTSTWSTENYDIFHFYLNIYKLFYVVSEINIHSSISAPKETKV